MAVVGPTRYLGLRMISFARSCMAFPHSCLRVVPQRALLSHSLGPYLTPAATSPRAVAALTAHDHPSWIPPRASLESRHHRPQLPRERVRRSPLLQHPTTPSLPGSHPIRVSIPPPSRRTRTRGLPWVSQAHKHRAMSRRCRPLWISRRMRYSCYMMRSLLRGRCGA